MSPEGQSELFLMDLSLPLLPTMMESRALEYGIHCGLAYLTILETKVLWSILVQFCYNKHHGTPKLFW